MKNGRTAKANLKLELLDETKLETIAYNEMADKCYQTLKENDVVFINGKITDGMIEIKYIEITYK